MKKLYILLIILGVLSFVGIILISAYSEKLSETVKSIGFIGLGYLGIILFTYGWMKIFRNKNQK